MICAGARERSALCWECFINLPPPPYRNYFCQRAPGGGAKTDREGVWHGCGPADTTLLPPRLLRAQGLRLHPPYLRGWWQPISGGMFGRVQWCKIPTDMQGRGCVCERERERERRQLARSWSSEVFSTLILQNLFYKRATHGAAKKPDTCTQEHSHAHYCPLGMNSRRELFIPIFPPHHCSSSQPLLCCQR